MAAELDKTYRDIAQRLPENPDVRFEKVKDKEELILTPLDALYDLTTGPQEGYDRASEFPEIMAAIRARIEALVPSFPAEVQASWRGTQSKKVYQTPAGSLPEAVTTG